MSTKWAKNIPTTIYISLLTHNLVYPKIHAQCYIQLYTLYTYLFQQKIMLVCMCNSLITVSLF